MIIRSISNAIQETLKNRERALARKTAVPNEATEEGTLHYGDLATRSTFVTMASANGTPQSRVIIQGGEVDRGTQFGFDSSGNKGVYQDFGSGYSGEGYRPISGINNISVIYKGGYKAIREATVSWVANSFADLDDLTPAFLTVGKSVLLEWGWVFSNPKINRKILENSFIVRELDTFTFHPDVFQDPQPRIEAAGGNFDVLFGTVSNFDYQLNDSGGFNCTTKIISTGVNMFDSQQSQPKTPEITTTPVSKEEFIEKQSKANMDGLVSSILNLEKIFFLKVAGLTGNRYGWDGEPVEITAPNWSSGFLFDNNFKKNPNLNVLVNKTGYPQSLIIELGTDKEIFFSKMGYLDASDTKNSFFESEDFFVSFGWLEDNLFTRYLSYSTTVGGEILNTLRSVEPERDGNGNPILNYGKTPEGFEIQLGADGNYYYIDAEGKKQNLLTPPNSNDDPISTKYKNRSVLIRSHEKLLPIDPLKFFLPGQNIPSTSVSIIDVVKEGHAETIRNHLEILFNINSSPDKEFLDLRYSDSQYGRLRRVMINTKEIKRAFGIDVDKTFNPNDNNGRIFKESEVKPPKSMKEGIKRLLTNLSANFHNYWNFEIVADTLNATNMKVVDTNSTPEFDVKLYSEFKENSHKIKKRGVFKFPAYTLGSTVKSQELAFKIPDSQAISAMYGSNQNKGGGLVLDTSNENSILQAVFANDKSSQYIDTRFQNMERAHRLVSEGGHKIGAKNISDKVTFEGSVEIEPGTEWWSSFSNILQTNEPQTGVVYKNDTQRNIYEQAEMKAEIASYKFNESMTELLTAPDGIDKQAIKELEDKIQAILDNDENYERLLKNGYFRTLKYDSNRGDNPQDIIDAYQRQINSLRRAGLGSFYLLKPATAGTGVDSGFQISLFPAGLTIAKSHLFSFAKDSAVYQSNYLIPAELSLTIDGIGGILPGEIIQTDYIQAKYNANIKSKDGDVGPFAFFQIFGLEQKLDSTSWETSITTKMRVNNNVLKLDAGEVLRIINENKKANKAPVDAVEIPLGEGQIPGQFSLNRGGKFAPEGNFDVERGLANKPNVIFTPTKKTKEQRDAERRSIRQSGLKFGVVGSQSSTYDILRLSPKFELVAPPTTPLEDRRQEAVTLAIDDITNDDVVFEDIAVEEYIPPDDEREPTVPDRYLRAEEAETKRQMEKLQIKQGTTIDDETAAKITDEERDNDKVTITPVVSEKVADVIVETKNLEDSSNESDNSGEKSSTPKVVVDKELEEKLDSSLAETSDDKKVEAVQKITGVFNKVTQFTGFQNLFSKDKKANLDELEKAGRGREMEKIVPKRKRSREQELRRQRHFENIERARQQGTHRQTTITGTMDSQGNVISQNVIKNFEEDTKSADVLKNIKEANKEATKAIKTEVKETKRDTPKVETKEPNFASTFWGASDQNNDYIYELIPGWKPDTIKANPRTGQAAGTRDGKVETDRRRKFWDEMIEPQRDLNKTPTAKTYGNIYAYRSGNAGEKLGFAESDLSVVKDSFEKLKGQFDYARNDTPNGEDVVWTPRFSRPNPDGKAKA
mgnify:CR=1 FL=1